jgi:hypothetical protein
LAVSRHLSVFVRERRPRPGFAVFGERRDGTRIVLVGKSGSAGWVVNDLAALPYDEVSGFLRIVFGALRWDGTWEDTLLHRTPEGGWLHGRRLAYKR